MFRDRKMPRMNGHVEWLHAIIGSRARFHPAPSQMRRECEVTGTGGEVEGLRAIVGRRAGLRPSPRQVLRNEDMAEPGGGGVEGLPASIGR